MMGRYEKPKPRKCKNIKTIVLIFFAVTLIILLLYNLQLFNSATSHTPTGNAKNTTSNTNSIAIPGYEALTLQANKKQQTLTLPNPSQNNCIFILTLKLEDGTELWKSNEILPGKVSKPIVLTHTLAPGVYPNASLEYTCYSNDNNRTPLNGAATKVTLRVE